MNSNKLTSIVIITLLFMFGLAGLFLILSESNDDSTTDAENSPSLENSPNVVQQDDTVIGNTPDLPEQTLGVETYNFVNCKVSFEYDTANYVLIEGSDTRNFFKGAGFSVSLNSLNGGDELLLSCIDTTSESTEVFFSRIISEINNGLAFTYSVPSKLEEVDGTNAYQVTYIIGNGPSAESENLLIFSNEDTNKGYIIRLTDREGTGSLNDIVSSIKFVN